MWLKLMADKNVYVEANVNSPILTGVNSVDSYSVDFVQEDDQ